MNNKTIKDNNYIVIQGYMINQLNLKGNDLLIYAIIAGFSQDDQWFNGSLHYFGKWTNSSKQGVLNSIKSLLDKRIIEKEEYISNGVKRVRYRTIDTGQISLPGVVKKVDQGGQQSLPNNINNNINNNKEEIYKEESIFDYYQNNIGNLSPAQYEVLNNLLNKYDYNKLKEAIDIAINNNAKNLNYIKSVLANGTFKNKKDKELPTWFDKEIEYETVDSEELAELEKEFEIFN